MSLFSFHLNTARTFLTKCTMALKYRNRRKSKTDTLMPDFPWVYVINSVCRCLGNVSPTIEWISLKDNRQDIGSKIRQSWFLIQYQPLSLELCVWTQERSVFSNKKAKGKSTEVPTRLLQRLNVSNVSKCLYIFGIQILA